MPNPNFMAMIKEQQAKKGKDKNSKGKKSPVEPSSNAKKKMFGQNKK